MGSEQKSEKMSFSIDVGGGKKLRLIDMAKEDDYLIASPLFNSLEDLRLSVTLDGSHADGKYKCQGIPPCAEMLQQNEQKLLSSSSNSSMETGRPSYRRNSLAWDTAFFTNDGVLDPDELFLMNKGLKPRSLPSIQEDKHLWRSEPAPITFKKNDYAHSNFQMTSHKQVTKVKSMSTLLQSSDQSKNQIARSAEYRRTSLKPPTASGLLRGIPTGRGRRSLMEKKNDVAKEGKSVQIRAVSSLTTSNLIPLNTRPRRVTATSPDISKNYLKRKTEATRSKLSGPASLITPYIYLEKTKCQATDLRHSTQSLPAISNYSSGESTPSFTVDRLGVENNKECPEPNPPRQFSSLLEHEISSPVPFSTASPFGTSPAPTQSGLRMPSPTMGYFNEEKPVNTTIGGLRYQLQMCNKSPSRSSNRCRKTPVKVAYSPLAADIHQKNHRLVDNQDLPSNRKRTTDIRHTPSNLRSTSISGMKGENFSTSTNLCALKNRRKKIDQSTTLKGQDKQQCKELSHSMLDRDNKRNKTKGQINGSRVTYHPKKDNENSSTPQLGGEVNKLSKLLEITDLNKVKLIEPKQRLFQHSTLTKENVPELFSNANPLPCTGPMPSTRNPLGKKNIRPL